jgi:ketosteroid isomerase-like protein
MDSQPISTQSTVPDLAAFRRSVEAFARGDIDAAVASAWPEGARACYEDVRDSYEDFEQVIEELCDLGNGVGFAVVAARGRLPGSASRVELRYANVAIWREGLERITYYTDIAEARATAERLAEERGSALSQENVQVVRRSLEAWQRDDLDSFLVTVDSAVAWHAALERLVKGIESFYRGHEGMRQMWHSYRTELEDLEFEAQEFRDLGDDRVLLLGHVRWRAARSEVVVESPLGLVMTVSRGRIVQSIDYLSHEEALKAAGLDA